MGYVWQFLPMAGLMGSAVGMEQVLSQIQTDGLLGMMNGQYSVIAVWDRLLQHSRQASGSRKECLRQLQLDGRSDRG